MLSPVCSILVTMMASQDYMSELVSRLAKTLYDRCNGHYELVTELVKEISNQNLSDSTKATNDIRNLSHFLVLNSENLTNRHSVRIKHLSHYCVLFQPCWNFSIVILMPFAYQWFRALEIYCSIQVFLKTTHLRIEDRVPIRMWVRNVPVFLCDDSQ